MRYIGYSGGTVGIQGGYSGDTGRIQWGNSGRRSVVVVVEKEEEVVVKEYHPCILTVSSMYPDCILADQFYESGV